MASGRMWFAAALMVALYAWVMVFAIAVLSGYTKDDEWLEGWSWATLPVATLVTGLFAWCVLKKEEKST